MAVSTIDPNGLNIGQIGGTRNKIFNGAMQVHQRGNQTSVSSNSYSLDRWEVATVGGTAVYDLKQSTDVPTGQGFANSFELDVTTADTAMGSGDGYIFRQAFEGQDLQDLKKGTSNAEQVTVQFWVKSPKAGTHILELFDIDNTRQVSAAYSVATANTWEKFTITFPADTTGAFDNDNARSLILQWWLAAGTDYTSGTLNTSWASATTANRVVGQVNCVDDAANNFYITGVQLEAGDTATPFEHRSFGQELALCQRYTLVLNSNDSNLANRMGFGISSGTTNAYCQIRHPVPMRAKPSLTTVIAAGQTINLSDTAGSTTTTSLVVQGITADVNQTQIDATVASGLTAFRSYYLEFGGAGSTLTLSAEL